MTPLEIISRLCEITEELSGIVKKQQEMIERSKVEEGGQGGTPEHGQ